MSQVITSNGEKFIKSTYNGFSILIREKDNYINATKMVQEINQITQKRRQLKKCFQGKDFNDYIEELEKYNRVKFDPVYYDLEKGYNKTVSGRYVHPKIINYIAYWASPKYQVIVSKIMDSINERAKLKNISDNDNLNEIINKLNEENKELRDKITEQEKTIEEQEETIIEQEETIEEQDIKIFNESVRVNINNRKLTIHQEDGLIKISANNSRKFKDIIAQYNFPASMNVKMSIKKEFNIKNLNNVPEEKLNDIINYLKGLQPKEIIQ